VTRGEAVESVHRIHGAVQGLDDGGVTFGDPAFQTFWRSAMKPFQALSALEDGAMTSFGFGAPEIALSCASHGGTPVHVELAASMLERMSLPVSALACGPQVPYDDESARILSCAGHEPTRLHNNCSGKHAAMLSLAVHQGWDPVGYERDEHPVQQRVHREVRRWLDVDPEQFPWGVDGCGLPTVQLPLTEMAGAYSWLVGAAARGDAAPAAIVSAMTGHPYLTSSPGRAPLVLMEATDGRLLAKEGAEGVICVAAPSDGWGMALKVEDGALRATGPAAVAALDMLGLLAPHEVERLADMRQPVFRNTLGAPVGEVLANLVPERI